VAPCGFVQSQLNETKGRIDQMTAQLNTAIAQAGLVGQLTNATAIAATTLDTLNTTLNNASSLTQLNGRVEELEETKGMTNSITCLTRCAGQTWFSTSTSGTCTALTWIPVVELSFSLGRPALTLFLATGSLRAPTASGSLGFFSIRFTVDGVSYGDPRYGQRSINANGATTAVIPWIAWAVSHSLNLSAGSHNVSVDGYGNADNPGCLCLDDDAVSYNSTKCQLVVKT